MNMVAAHRLRRVRHHAGTAVVIDVRVLYRIVTHRGTATAKLDAVTMVVVDAPAVNQVVARPARNRLNTHALSARCTQESPHDAHAG